MNGNSARAAIITGIIQICLITLLISPAMAEYQPLGSYRIRIASMVSPANAQNAVLAGTFLKGQVIQPGEIFSYNDTVGMRTAERGFIPGYISTTSSHPVKSIGGGVCTTASILHQAVKASGLKVIERHNHVAPTSYLPQGEDAAIWYGIEDYKFQNVLQNPVTIDAGVEEECLQITIVEITPEKAMKSELEGMESSFKDDPLQFAGADNGADENPVAMEFDLYLEDNNIPEEAGSSGEAATEAEDVAHSPEKKRVNELVYAASLNSLGALASNTPHHYSALSILGQGYLLTTLFETRENSGT